MEGWRGDQCLHLPEPQAHLGKSDCSPPSMVVRMGVGFTLQHIAVLG